MARTRSRERLLRAHPSNLNLRKPLKVAENCLKRVNIETVQRLFEEFVRQLEVRANDGAQSGVYKHLKGQILRPRKRAALNTSSTQREFASWHGAIYQGRRGNSLCDMGLIRDQRIQWFISPLSTKSPTLDPNIVDELQVWPPFTLLDYFLSIVEVEETIKNTSNREAVGPDDVSAGIHELALDGDRDGTRCIVHLVEQFHAIVIAI